MSVQGQLGRLNFLSRRRGAGGATAEAEAHTHPELDRLKRRYGHAMDAVGRALVPVTASRGMVKRVRDAAASKLDGHIEGLTAVANEYREFVASFDCDRPHPGEHRDAVAGIAAIAKYVRGFEQLRSTDRDGPLASALESLDSVLGAINAANRDFLARLRRS